MTLMVIDVFVLADTFAQGAVLLLGVALVVLFFMLLFFVLASCGVLPKRLVLESAAPEGASLMVAPVSVGDEGMSVTRLCPSGKAVIGERTLDVVSDGAFIEPECVVRVIEVSGNRIVVCTVK